MIFYAVIDTNVLVSAMLLPDSVPGFILKHTFAGTIVPVVNKEIIDEYRNVLKRQKFGFENKDIDKVISNILENSLNLERTPSNKVFVDKNDVVFYEITLSARKDKETYLVTGNTKHFPKEPFVVTPREMLDIIEKSGK